MVFKRVLKGIGRLMLTTAVMCGVGLFLCSSEVKAEVKVILEAGNDTNGNPGGFTVTVTAAQNDDISKITKIQLMDDSSTSLYSLTTGTDVDTTLEGTSNVFPITSSDFLEKIDKASINSDGKDFTIKNAKVTYETKPASGSGTGTPTTKDSLDLDPVITKTIYKISAPALDISKYETDLSSSSLSYTITASYVEGNPQVGYGYDGDEYSIKSSATDYYANYHTGSASEWTEEGEFKDATTPYSGTLGTNPIPTKVQYFPKFNDVWFETTGSTNVYLDGDGKATGISLEAIFDNTNLNNSSGKDRNIIMSNMVIVPELTNTGSTNIAGYTWSGGGGTPSTTINFGTSTKPALSDINFPGVAKVKAIARKSDGVNGETPPINSVETKSSDNYLSLNVYAQPTGILLQNVPISVMAGGNATTVKIFKGIEPGGANQNLLGYTASLSVRPSGVIDVTNASFNSSTGEITVKANSTATAGAAATVTLKLDNGITTPISNSFDVKIISFDKDKTISLMNSMGVVTDEEQQPSSGDNIQHNTSDKISLCDNSGSLKFSVSCSNLYYIESDDNYINIWYTDNSGALKMYMMRCRLKTVEETFRNSPLIRCNRKYIVNRQKVKVLKKERDGYVMELDNESIPQIPVTKTYLKNVLKEFSE